MFKAHQFSVFLLLFYAPVHDDSVQDIPSVPEKRHGEFFSNRFTNKKKSGMIEKNIKQDHIFPCLIYDPD